MSKREWMDVRLSEMKSPVYCRSESAWTRLFEKVHQLQLHGWTVLCADYDDPSPGDFSIRLVRDAPTVPSRKELSMATFRAFFRFQKWLEEHFGETVCFHCQVDQHAIREGDNIDHLEIENDAHEELARYNLAPHRLRRTLSRTLTERVTELGLNPCEVARRAANDSVYHAEGIGLQVTNCYPTADFLQILVGMLDEQGSSLDA